MGGPGERRAASAGSRCYAIPPIAGSDCYAIAGSECYAIPAPSRRSPTRAGDANDPMSTITTLEADLAALEAFLAGEDAHGRRELAGFVEQRLRLENAFALAARLPRSLAEMFPDATPLTEWARAAGSSYDVRPTPPEEERAFQWSFRYPAAVVATLARGCRPPTGWAPTNRVDAAKSTEPWDRLWALSEVVRLGLPLPDDSEQALAPLDDEDAEVRWWAWLAAVRWAEIEPERRALREAVAKRAPEADPLAAPIAAWAAMLMNCATGLTPALARSLARPPAEIGDALSLVRRLGAQLEDLSQLIEPLIDDPDEHIASGAVYALMQNTPQRWRRVWALTSETQLHTSPERSRNGPPQTYTGPTPRATSARFALGGAAKRHGADAAATFVEHADQWWVIPIIEGLGPHARAAAPALVAKLEAAMGTQYPQVRKLVAALGAVGGPIAWEALERLAATHERIAVHLGGLGTDAAPMIGRLLAASLAPEVHEALLDGLGVMPPEPSLAPAVLRFLESPNLDLRLFAIYVAAGFEVDDTIAVRLASTFVACAAEVPPFRRPLHYAAHRMAPNWASRIDHESDIIAVRCIEALGWTRHYGEDHLPALRALAARAPTSLRRRYALEAAQRISAPEPMFQDE